MYTTHIYIYIYMKLQVREPNNGAFHSGVATNGYLSSTDDTYYILGTRYFVTTHMTYRNV